MGRNVGELHQFTLAYTTHTTHKVPPLSGSNWHAIGDSGTGKVINLHHPQKGGITQRCSSNHL